MILVADSGSTKTDWRWIGPDKRVRQFTSPGLNPYFLQADEIVALLQKDVRPKLGEATARRGFRLRFYGAGCTGPGKNRLVAAALGEVFPRAGAEVASDLLGAARALCGRNPGMAAILGTGSNSCCYDGRKIIARIPSLGFILGDEGGGADLGKRLLKGFLYQEMPAGISSRFAARFGISREAVLEQVYRRPHPNRYLASFARFIHRNLAEEYIRSLVTGAFREFFDRHICRCANATALTLGCTGSIAFYFRDILRKVGEEKGIPIGKILKSPVAALARYHLAE